MFTRLKSNIDPFTTEGFIKAGEPYLRSLGVTRQKAHYCVQVAHAFTNGELDKIVRMNDEDAHTTLLSIKGVGPWTANIYLLMALRRPDIWPDGDVALATAVLRQRGSLDPRAHVFLARGRSLPQSVATLLVSPQPFEPADLEALRRWCADKGFEELLSPDHATSAALAGASRVAAIDTNPMKLGSGM